MKSANNADYTRDRSLKETWRVRGYVRYMDDFICFAENKEILHKLLDRIQEFIERKLKLHLTESATRIAPVSEGFPFLGFRVFSNLFRLQRPNLIRLRRKVKSKENQYRQGKMTEAELASSMRSIVAHIAHANSAMMRRKEFESSLSLA